MKPQIGDVWQPVNVNSRFGCIEILTDEMDGEEFWEEMGGCYGVRFLDRNREDSPHFRVIGGGEMFVLKHSASLENK